MADTIQAQRKTSRNFVLLLLTLVYMFNFIDRQIIGILSPFIQADLELSNSQMGLLKGFLFALFYTVVGIPIAWLADRYNRVNIIAISLAVWSGFTALTGMANSFLSIGLARMGVGIGEAGGSPPSHSIISDLFPKEERARALAIYSIGIPIGIGFAYFTAGFALGNPEGDFNWRTLLIWLGIIGVALAVLVRVFIPEPERGQQEKLKKDQLNVPFLTALKTLLTIKSWWAMCMGIAHHDLIVSSVLSAVKNGTLSWSFFSFSCCPRSGSGMKIRTKTASATPIMPSQIKRVRQLKSPSGLPSAKPAMK